MRVEIERFPDKRLKVVSIYDKTDRNARFLPDKTTVVKKKDELRLETDTLEAIDIWNNMRRFPELDRAIRHVLDRFFAEKEWIDL